MKSWGSSPRGAPAAAALALCLGVLSLSEPALAQRVLLLKPPTADEVVSEAFNRLRAELVLQDFDVSVLDAESDTVSPATLELEARKAGAFAGISLMRSGTGATIDVCIADRVTGKTTQRRLAMTGTREAPRVLAVRAVDLLRSSLRELPPGERPPPDVVGVQAEPAPVEVEAWSAPPPPRWQLRAAGSALGADAESRPAFGGTIAVSYQATSTIDVRLGVTGPLLGARYATELGVASVRQELGLASVTWDALAHRAASLGPSLGAGVYHLHAQGEVEAPLRALGDDVWSFAWGVGLDAELRLTRAFSISGSAHALFLHPRPVVAVDTEQRALGLPVVLASLGVGVAF